MTCMKNYPHIMMTNFYLTSLMTSLSTVWAVLSYLVTKRGNFQASFSNIGSNSAYIGLTFYCLGNIINSVVLCGLRCKLLPLQQFLKKIFVHETQYNN